MTARDGVAYATGREELLRRVTEKLQPVYVGQPPSVRAGADIALTVYEEAIRDPHLLALAAAQLPRSARDALRVFLDACEAEGLGAPQSQP